MGIVSQNQHHEHEDALPIHVELILCVNCRPRSYGPDKDLSLKASSPCPDENSKTYCLNPPGYPDSLILKLLEDNPVNPVLFNSQESSSGRREDTFNNEIVFDDMSKFAL